MKQLQNISIVGLILFVFTNCNFPLKNTITEYQDLPDTLFVQLDLAHKYGEAPPQEPLMDSVTNLYISQAHESTRFTSLDSLDTYYKAYNEGTYQLGEKIHGKIIRFEPDGNAYYSIQLFLFNERGAILDALELSYLFGEEGANGEGAASFIKDKSSTTVFLKQYWINRLGENANFIEEIDTIVAYEIKHGRKIAISMDSTIEKQAQALFIN